MSHANAVPSYHGRELAHVLAPLSVEAFVADHWEKRSVHIPGDAGKFEPLFSRAAFDRAVVDATFTRQRARSPGFNIRAAYRNAANRAVFMQIGPDLVLDQLVAGASICVNEIDAGDRELARFASSVRRQLGVLSAVRFNCYLSPDAEGFDTHFDVVHAVTLQIEGEKTWRFCRRPSVHYPRAHGIVAGGAARYGHPEFVPQADEQLSTPDPSEFETVVLKPGDVLYLPPGTWHSAKARGSSLALNLAIPTLSVFDFVADALREALAAAPQWRRSVPAIPEHARPAGAIHGQLDEFLTQRLAQLRDEARRLAPRALAMHRMWHRLVSESTPLWPAEPLEPGDDADAYAVTHPPLSYLVDASQHGVESLWVYAGGHEVAVDPRWLPLVRGLSHCHRADVETAAEWLTPTGFRHEAAAGLASLRQAGVLTPLPVVARRSHP